MNILFIGQYRDKGLDGKISRDYLELLLETNHNIVASPIYCSKHIQKPTEAILRAENQKFSQEPDLVIQSLPPEKFTFTNIPSVGIYNIGQLRKTTGLVEKLNLLDYIVVPTETEVISYEKSCANIKSIYPINTSGYDTVAEEISQLKSTFNFYFVDEFSSRSNLEGLILAFNHAFSLSDNVRLVIYSWVEGKTPTESVDIIIGEINKIKKNMGKYQKREHYIPDLVITPNLDRANLLQIHRQCDCLVVPNRECFVSQAVVDALHLNRGILHTRCIGISTLIVNNYFRNSKSPIVDTLGTFSDTTLSNNNGAIPCSDIWHDINLNLLSNDMINFYQNHKDKKNGIESNKPENIKKESIKALEDVINQVVNK